MSQIKVLVWNENVCEYNSEEGRQIYPNGIHEGIAGFLREDDRFAVETATLQDHECGCTQEVLDNTDVLIWWSHIMHHEVSDEIVDRIHKRVLEGMGLILLHSSHFSKIFKKINGTPCDHRWRCVGEKERLWVINPTHPIAQGVYPYFEIPKTEMYGEYFNISNPNDIVFISWFEGGNVDRSGVTFLRGSGKIFFFRPGHETYPIYYQSEVQTVIKNAVAWAKPCENIVTLDRETYMPEPLEPIGK